MNPSATCTNLHGLLATERAAIRCHLDAHPALASTREERREAMRCFVEGYGGLMREIYCMHVCKERARCEAFHGQPPGGGVLPRPAV